MSCISLFLTIFSTWLSAEPGAQTISVVTYLNHAWFHYYQSYRCLHIIILEYLICKGQRKESVFTSFVKKRVVTIILNESTAE